MSGSAQDQQHFGLLDPDPQKGEKYKKNKLFFLSKSKWVKKREIVILFVLSKLSIRFQHKNKPKKEKNNLKMLYMLGKIRNSLRTVMTWKWIRMQMKMKGYKTMKC